MIRDGLDAPPVRIVLCERDCGRCLATCRWADRDARMRAEGWQPISTAPLGKLGADANTPVPNWIEGLTTHDRVVPARYLADGDYRDRWSNSRGNVLYNLTHWREPTP